MLRKIRIGTRSSRLALWQARFVAEELKKFFPALEVELVKVHTTGDKIFLHAGNAGTFHRGGC